MELKGCTLFLADDLGSLRKAVGDRWLCCALLAGTGEDPFSSHSGTLHLAGCALVMVVGNWFLQPFFNFGGHYVFDSSIKFNLFLRRKL